MNVTQKVAAEFARGRREGQKRSADLSSRWGFKKDPFAGELPSQDSFVGHEVEVVKLARAIGRSVAGTGEVLACIGALGVGVSTTLRTVHQSLQESGSVSGLLVEGKQLTQEHIPSRDEDEETTSVSYFDYLISKTDFRKVRYLIIDDADDVADLLGSFVDRIHSATDTFRVPVTIIIGLHMAGWLSVDASFRGMVGEQIWIGPLEPEQIVELLKRRIAEAKGQNDSSPFDIDSLARVAVLSCGLALIALTIARIVLSDASARGSSRIQVTQVDDVARAFGLRMSEEMKAWRQSRDDARSAVMRALTHHPQGMTTTQLAAESLIGRTTVGYHLASLESLGAVARKRAGRDVYYAPTLAGRCILDLLVFNQLCSQEGDCSTIPA